MDNQAASLAGDDENEDFQGFGGDVQDADALSGPGGVPGYLGFGPGYYDGTTNHEGADEGIYDTNNVGSQVFDVTTGTQ